MRKKINFMMLTLIATLASLAFTSCSKDDEPQSVENYFFALTSVGTNLVDANGQSLAQTFIKDLIAASSDLDSNGMFHIGNTTKESALNAFDKSVENYRKSFNDAYAGKNLLPEGGYIDFTFSLLTQSVSVVTSATIHVTNNGASSN